MKANNKWTNLGFRHGLWSLIRFYFSLKAKSDKERLLNEIKNIGSITITSNQSLPVSSENANLFIDYLKERELIFEEAVGCLRTENESLSFCNDNNFVSGITVTKSKDHHQSSKSMIAAVSSKAQRICLEKGLTIDPNPQSRCIWFINNELHVTARNLDGAIPSLANPTVIWEIKEYWGKTKGGSKMSDAVYECHLVGTELKDYEERSKNKIYHIVFLDGKEQWEHRKSDLKRFIDLMNQGLIDNLIIGKEVETEWEKLLKIIL